MIQKRSTNTPKICRHESGLLSCAKGGCVTAMQQLIIDNIGLFYSVAKSLQRYDTRAKQIDLHDLVAEAVPEFRRAVELFDPNRGFRFSTFAVPHLRSGMQRSFPKWTGRYSQTVREVRKLIESGVDPATLHAHPDTIADALRPEIHFVSITAPIGIGDTTVLDVIADVLQRSPEQELAESEEQRVLRRMLTTLTPIERTVIEARFFFAKTLEEVGPLLFALKLKPRSLSRERVRQIEAQALQKLAKHLIQAGFQAG